MAATAGVCAVVLLSACSGRADEASGLPLYTPKASTSPVSTAGGPTATSSSSAAPSTTSAPPRKAQTFTIRRGALPAGLTGDRAAAAEAWLVYWEYLAVADSIPAMDPATSGSVMTGGAATRAQSYVAKLKRTKTHVVGTVKVNMTSVSLHGATATLCGRLDMNAFEFTAAGVPVESTMREFPYFKGTAVKSGPRWRISDYANLTKSC